MARSSSSFSRTAPKFKTQPRTIILCEDSRSCLDYLEEASNFYRAFAEVRILHCGHTDPKGIVEAAIKYRSSFEQVFCAIDRDAHETFEEAMQLAKAFGIEMVVSYPCYEYWLLLHHRMTRAPYTAVGGLSAADRVTRELRTHPGMSDYAKGSSKGLFTKLLGQLPAAQARAQRGLVEAANDQEPNPSTSLHLLLKRLELLGKPAPIE